MNEIAEQGFSDTSRNPFSSGEMAARESNNAIADTAQAREIAEVQAAMVIAQRFPRNATLAMDRILNACTRPTLAEGALYSYARGGTEITGPSIRLAETLAQNWGNIQFGIRELEQRNGESTVEAYAWDLQTNTRQVKVFQVPHKRHTKQGGYKLTDPRDIYELVANQGARRLRACILGVIPGDVIEAAVSQCDQTMKTSADTSPEAQAKIVDAFSAFGVSKEQIEKRIQSRLDAIRPAQVVALKKIYASLRDGMSKADEWFESVEDKGANLTEEIRQRHAQRGKQKAAQGVTVDDVRKSLEAAKDEEALDAAWATLEDAVDKGPEQETELGKLYSARLKAIKG
jgi:hypothetical protein